MEAPRRIGRTVRVRIGAEGPVESSLSNGSQNEATPSMKEILLQICSKEISSIGKPHLGSILNVISKQIEKKSSDIAEVDLLALFTCLQIPLINDSKAVRAAGLRVVRLCLHNHESAKKITEANLHHFIAKCLDILVDNLAERSQALRLCRRWLLVDPGSFPVTLGRSIVALALDGTKEKDRLVRASLALLGELCVLNPGVFVESGGIRCFCSAVLDCPSGRMQEAMVACLLYLFDTEKRRDLCKMNLRFLIAPYSDFHYRHYADTADNPSATNQDRELRLLCAKQALLSVLRCWSGLLHVMSCKIIEDLVKVLLPCHLETRKSMLEFFYSLLRLPLPEWTDEFTVALQATDPSRVQDAWKLQDGYVAYEGKCLLPHVSKFRPNLVLNHTALLVYCLVEAKLIQTLVEVIVTSDTFISVRATILLGELLHLSSTLLPPACHGTKLCLPKLVDCITSLKCDPVHRHRAAQAAAALSKIHQLKKNGVVPHSLALQQIVELERRSNIKSNQKENKVEEVPADVPQTEIKSNNESDTEVRPSRDPDGIVLALLRDCGVLAQKDPLLWNWPVLSNVLLWSRSSVSALEDSSLRSVVRRVMQFYKPLSNQFCQCELSNNRTRLYSTVGCFLMDFLTNVEEVECEKILSEFLEDMSSAIRDITLASSAHDCLLSPGRLSTTACQDYFLFIGRLSSTANGITALEKAGIFQDLLELVASTNHDCYLKVIVSTLDYHTDGYARAILKKVLLGTVESGRIYSTQHMRVLLRAAAEHGSTTTLAKWAIPLLINQLKDKCRNVVMTSSDILDEATDDPACIEVLVPIQAQFAELVQQQEIQHLDSRGILLLIKTLSIPTGFTLWLETGAENDKSSLIQLELDRWMNRLNIRYVQLIESDLADGLTQHQRADDGRFGRLSNIRHAIRDLPIPPHLFSQLNQHREGLDFLRTSGQLPKLFTIITNALTETDEEVLELKSAMWACAHLGTSEAGVALLESAEVVEGIVRLASFSPVLALRGTAFFALNLIAMTSAGVDILARLGWASIKRRHGELWHVVDDSEWTSLFIQKQIVQIDDRNRTVSQSSSHSVTFAEAMVTSTPRRQAGQSWETDSQPYSLEGSSVHFDSDTDSSMPDSRAVRRAYTLPPASQAAEYVHSRSFSDSHYPPAEDLTCELPSSPTSRPKTRIWTKLRTSLRLRRSKRLSLPARETAVVVQKEMDVVSSAEESEEEMIPLPFEFQLNRIGSILNRLKTGTYKKRLFNKSGLYIGLCLPVELSYLHPPAEWFDPRPDQFLTTLDFTSMVLNEDTIFTHEKDSCIICSVDPSIKNHSAQTDEERWLVRKELLRLVVNMGSSVGLNANEQGLLRLKQRFPWAFHDICLFSDVCQILATYGYRLRARRFLHELFIDSPFEELYTMAAARLLKYSQ